MKITARVRSAILALLAALACSAQLSLFAAQPWRFTDPPPAAAPSADENQPTVFRLDDAEQRNVIIEFFAPPLLEARKSRDVRAAAATLDSLSVQLAKDLERIEGRGRDRVTTLASEASALRHEYRLTFAGASARVSREALPQIRALSYVRAVHEDRPMEAYLSSSVPHIGIPQVRAKYGRRGKGIVVAIIDTGINYNHWALGKGFGPGFKVAGGYDFVNGDADPMDDNGHGTHVAGIVAADFSAIVGVAPGATLLAYKVLNEKGSGDLSTVLAGVERAIDPDGDGDPSDRADVVNMSLGGPRGYDDPLVRAVERGSEAGVVFCLAAGNAFLHGTIGSPAAAPSAITVGATDRLDQAADFSSRGPVGGTWATKPEVSAPGVAIMSSFEDRTIAASGTSMAAPHVSGLAALLLEEHPDWTPQDVKAAMVSTAKPVFQKDTGRVNVVSAGGGRIDAVRAMEASIFPSPATVSFGVVPKRGQAWTSSVTVKLTNRGSAAETLTVKAQQQQLPAGAQLTATPDTVTLAGGATAEVKFTLELGAATPEPEDKVVLSGMIELTGSRSSLHLPWMTVNGDVVSATYTGTDAFAMYISAGRSQAAMWPEGPRTFGAFAQLTLAVDILVLSKSEAEAQPRLIIRERQTVEGNTPVTIIPEDASYELAVAGVNEAGIPLGDLTPADFHAVWHELNLPSFSFVKLIYSGEDRSLRISPLEKTRIATYETLFTGSSRYFAAYRHLRGIRQNETLAVTPADWATQKIRHLCDTECVASVGAGVASPVFFTYFRIPPGEDTWTIHITSPVENTYDFRAHVLVREKDFVVNRDAPWTYLSPAIRNLNGRVAASIFGRVSLGDYLSPDRETPITLGDGPVVLRLFMMHRQLELWPYAALGETLGENARSIKVSLTKTDGGAAGAHRMAGSFSMFDLTGAPGTYRLVATDDYKVAGRAGRLTLTSHYDNRIHEAPPTLSMLLITDARGASTSTVAARSRPGLVFAARESTIDKTGLYVWHSPVDPVATRAWWRRHGTSEWLPLDVSMTGEDYAYPSDDPGSPGNLFAAPLDATTESEGEIDLKILVGDEYGGTTEAMYEPAFVVGPPVVRRRTVRR